MRPSSPATAAALSLLALGCLALVPAAAAAPEAKLREIRNPHLGTATHFAQNWDPATVMPLIAAAGLGWIRDEIYWCEVEKSPGGYQVTEKTRKWIDTAQHEGLKVIVCLNTANPIYPDKYDAKAYAAAAAYLAKELAGKVQAIEVLNEPNGPLAAYYGGTWNGLERDGSNSPWMGKYVTLLNLTAKAVKVANPKMKVIGLGSAAPANFRQIAMGLAPEVDGITDHPYSYRTVPEIVPWANCPAILQRDGIATADAQGTFASQIRRFREQSEKYRGPRELWLTEWGYATCHETTGSMFAGFTESAQAKYILRRFMECLGLGVEVSIQYAFQNKDLSPDDPEQNFGLVEANLKPKPSYAAVRRLTAAMAGCQAKTHFAVKVFPMADRPDPWPTVWDGSKLAAPGTIPCYQFADTNGKPMVALWSAERADGDLQPRTAKVEILTTAPVVAITAFDLWTGKTFPVPFKHQGDRIVIQKLTIPDYPVTLTLE